MRRGQRRGSNHPSSQAFSLIAELISLKLRKLFYGTARLSPLQPRPSVPVQPLLLRMMKFRIHAGLLLVLALTLVSCKRESRIDWALRNKILMVGNGSEPKALDPHLVSSVGDSNILRSLFEGLVTFHPTDDSKNAPGVAERWESNDDYTVWTFYFREDAKWSNGDPVTPSDFVYSYERILSPDIASPYASMLYFLKNGKEFNEEKITDFTKVGVKALDGRTLQCTLRQPTAFFPQIVKHTTWLPVHPPTIERFGQNDAGLRPMTMQFTLWQRPGNHVSNGAFQLKSWVINKSVVVEPNPYYWDAKTVKLKGIHFHPLSNEFTEERAYRDGQVHYTYTMPPNMIDWYRRNDPKHLRLDPYAGVYYYKCNLNVPPLDNVKVRQALAYAIDRKKIVENVTLGGQGPAYALSPPIEGLYSPPQVVKYDPDRARDLLAEAGYPDGKGFPRIELLFNTQDTHRAIAETIQDMWKKELGITSIGLLNQEWKVYQSTLHDMKYEMARHAWIGDYVDPTTFLDMLRTGDSNNETGWGSPEYDQLLQDATIAPSAEAREKILQEAETIAMTELAFIPIYWYTRTTLVHPHIKNWEPLLLDNHPYKHVDLSAE